MSTNGRPPEQRRRKETIVVRVLGTEKRLLKSQAKREHLQLSTWLRHLGLNAVDKTGNRRSGQAA